MATQQHHANWPVLLIAAIALVLSAAHAAYAQSSGLASALLALPSTQGSGPDNLGTNNIAGRLYGANIDATILNLQGSITDFAGADRIRLSFNLPAGRTLPPALQIPFSGNRAEFDAWVQANAKDLMDILFPTSLSASATGIHAAHNQSQQFMLTTALGVTSARKSGETRRAEAGGLFELQQLSGDDRNGRAVQGIFHADGIHTSIQGRYTQLTDNGNTQAPTRTRSFNVAADFHPSITLNSDLAWKVGVTARTGVLYSTATTMKLGSIDYGGGTWTSITKDYSRLRLGGGTVLLASKSHVPSALVGDDWRFLADAINDRPLSWDVSYGGLAGFALNDSTTLNGKFLQTTSISSSPGGGHPKSTTVLTSISHLVRGVTPMDFGYKFTNSGGINGHSVFVQGYFGW